MDLSIVSSVLSTILALLAFLFAILTYFRTEKETRRTEYRLFLLELASTMRQLNVLITTFALLPNERKRFDEEWKPAVQRFVEISEQSTRWKRHKLVEEMTPVYKRLVATQLLLARLELPVKGPGDEGSAQVESVAAQLDQAVVDTRATTEKYLRALQAALKAL